MEYQKSKRAVFCNSFERASRPFAASKVLNSDMSDCTASRHVLTDIYWAEFARFLRFPRLELSPLDFVFTILLLIESNLHIPQLLSSGLPFLRSCHLQLSSTFCSAFAATSCSLAFRLVLSWPMVRRISIAPECNSVPSMVSFTSWKTPSHFAKNSDKMPRAVL